MDCVMLIYVDLIKFSIGINHNYIGAIELSSSQSGASSGPLFLSSLHCTDEDQSLLDDCYHDPLGLAVCDENFGLARAKCFGKKYAVLLV